MSSNQCLLISTLHISTALNCFKLSSCVHRMCWTELLVKTVASPAFMSALHFICLLRKPYVLYLVNCFIVQMFSFSLYRESELPFFYFHVLYLDSYPFHHVLYRSVEASLWGFSMSCLPFTALQRHLSPKLWSSGSSREKLHLQLHTKISTALLAFCSLSVLLMLDCSNGRSTVSCAWGPCYLT